MGGRKDGWKRPRHVEPLAAFFDLLAAVVEEDDEANHTFVCLSCQVLEQFLAFLFTGAPKKLAFGGGNL